MDLSLRGRLAVVTGADSGIGLATATVLAAEGATVLMTDLSPVRLEPALAQVRAAAAGTRTGGAGGRSHAEVFGIAADLTEPADVAALVELADAHGGAHIMAHLAGVHGANGDFLGLGEEDWRDTLDIDLLGAVRVCRAFLPGMLERGYGRVVLTASENAVQPYPEDAPYNAAKAGIVNLAKGLSKAYGPRGVHVNVVSPAFIETPMTDAMMQERAEGMGVDVGEAVAGFLREERPGITVQRRGKPREVADVIAFLCSDRASFVDGANWRVDGGSVATAFA